MCSCKPASLARKPPCVHISLSSSSSSSLLISYPSFFSFQTFCVVSRRFQKHYVQRFSATRALWVFAPWNTVSPLMNGKTVEPLTGLLFALSGPELRSLPLYESVLRLHCDAHHPGQLYLPRHDEADRRGRVSTDACYKLSLPPPDWQN